MHPIETQPQHDVSVHSELYELMLGSMIHRKQRAHTIFVGMLSGTGDVVHGVRGRVFVSDLIRRVKEGKNITKME